MKCRFLRSRSILTFSFLASLVMALSASAQPTLVSGPTTATIQSQAGKMQFVFDEPMDSGEVDITWAGTGLDASKFGCDWLDSVFGIPIPAVILECTYSGGLPEGIRVDYTLNKGNSGRMKSIIGEELEETTGNFITPGTGGGPGSCEGTNVTDTASAVITLLKEINYRQTSAADPVFDPVLQATLTASVVGTTNEPQLELASASLRKPDGTSLALTKISVPEIPEIPGFPIPSFPDTFFLSAAEPPDTEFPMYPSEAALDAAFPNGTYQMVVTPEGAAAVTISLPLNPSPAVPVPKIANLAALQNFDVSQPLTLQWNAFTGATAADSIQLIIQETDGPLVFSAPDPCEMIELAPTATSITIPAGTFTANRSYTGTLDFQRTTHHGEDTLEGAFEFAGVSRSTHFALGAPQTNLNTAEIANLEVANDGTITLTIEGAIASATVPALVEGSTDLETWSTVASVSKAVLEASGGSFDVVDPVPAGPATPHKFYRIKFP